MNKLSLKKSFIEFANWIENSRFKIGGRYSTEELYDEWLNTKETITHHPDKRLLDKAGQYSLKMYQTIDSKIVLAYMAGASTERLRPIDDIIDDKMMGMMAKELGFDSISKTCEYCGNNYNTNLPSAPKQ